MLERLELQQRLAGSEATGGAARAGLIRQQILPNMRKELAIANQELRAARRGKSITAREEAEQRVQELPLAILQRQLDAQEATKQNTEEIKRNTAGSAALSFEFGGQRHTDLVTEGVGL
jgi:hypothetical protein